MAGSIVEAAGGSEGWTEGSTVEADGSVTSADSEDEAGISELVDGASEVTGVVVTGVEDDAGTEVDAGGAVLVAVTEAGAEVSGTVELAGTEVKGAVEIGAEAVTSGWVEAGTVVSGGAVVSGAFMLSTRSTTVYFFATEVPASTLWDMTVPVASWEGSLVSLPRISEDALISSLASSRVFPERSGIVAKLSSCPELTKSVTSVFFATGVPAAGSVLITYPSIITGE